MTHNTWIALYFTFLVFIHELTRDPSKFVPAFVVLLMLGYIGFECIRGFRLGGRRLADDHDQEPQGTNSDDRKWPNAKPKRAAK
ncbi:hypothetical protein [Bradyrhizobium sp. CCBAU 11357]|uniref:hypothetical protein n=1 Tax=Bradyrhizobium sp. CCBAU 11357 TaxID=1630808 RepID=UPI002303047C|nr:hypothetical protein [Bradyrhizobium sp. CCBAU 11357]MDA9499661.1 hypothetical protein [Bradyrhizobium sp. CCBAU 11357]